MLPALLLSAPAVLAADAAAAMLGRAAEQTATWPAARIPHDQDRTWCKSRLACGPAQPGRAFRYRSDPFFRGSLRTIGLRKLLC